MLLTCAERQSQVGLDQHQVRRWNSWDRFTTLALAALAVLPICAADVDPVDTGLISSRQTRSAA